MKHTPGPWSIAEQGSLAKVVNPERETIAIATAVSCTKKQARANAHLIRTAPELLEALEALLDASRKHAENCAGSTGLHDMVSACFRAADVIAKAKGGE